MTLGIRKLCFLSCSLCLSLQAAFFPDDSIFEPTPSREPSYEEMVCREADDRSPAGFSSGAHSSPILAGTDSFRGLGINSQYGYSADVPPMLFGHAYNGSSLALAATRFMHDGSLDTTFGSGGFFIQDISANDDLIHSVIPHADFSRHLFVGRSGLNPVKWLVGRVLTGGQLDTSFYTAGYRTNLFNSYSEIARAVVAGGGIRTYVAGYAYTDKYGFAIAGYTNDGRLDTSFNTMGFRTTHLANDSGALAIRLSTYTGAGQLDRPLVAGAVFNGANWDFGLIRYETDGGFNTTFNTDGQYSFPVLSADDKAYAIEAPGTAFNFYVAGYANNGADNDAALIKVTYFGNLDTSFSTDGKMTVTFGAGGDDVFFAMKNAGYADDRGIYAAGSYDNGGNIDIAVAKILTNGILDTSFHTDGKNTYDVYGEADIARSIQLVRRDWRISVGASVRQGGNEDFALLRLEADGTLAQSSAPSRSIGSTGTGIIMSDISGNDTLARLRLHSNAVPFVAVGNSGSDILVLYYANLGFEHTGPQLTTSFHTNGYYEVNFGGTEVANGGLLTAGGVLYPVGHDGSDFLIAKLLTNFSAIDTTFNTTGAMRIDFSGNDVAYEMGSFAHVVGCDGSTPSNMAIAKINGTLGILDTSFHTDGKTTFTPSGTSSCARAVTSAAAPFFFGDDGLDWIVYSLWTDGRLNTSFHTDGLRTYDFGGSDTLGDAWQPNYSTTQFYLVGGNGSDFIVSRIMTGGQFDTAFNTAGYITIDFGTTAEKARGITYQEGFRSGGRKNYVVGDDGNNCLVARLMPSGELDTTFHSDGKRTYPISGTTTCRDIHTVDTGNIVVVGSSNGNADAFTLGINP